METGNSEPRKTFSEQLEVAGSELVERVKQLLAEGNVRQLRIRARDGDVYFETPLTVGVIAGGAVALAAPWLAILAVIAALVTKVEVEVLREVSDAQAAKADEKPEPGRDAA